MVFITDKLKRTTIAAFVLLGWTWHCVNSQGINLSATKDSLADTLTVLAPMLPDIQISATQLGTRLSKATGSVQMLNASELALSPPTSLANVTNQIPGISLQSGTANTQRLTIRGIGSRSPYGSNRVKAFFGTIPLSAADGTTSFEEIDASTIERIEVIKGPSSAIYGTGLGGAIVLMPKQPTQESPRATLRNQWGDYGFYKVGGTVRIGNEYHRLSVALNHTNWQGYRANNHLNQQNATAIWQHQTERALTTAIVIGNQFRAQIPSSLNAIQFAQNPWQAAPNWLAVKGFEKNQSILGGISNQFSVRHRLNNSSTLYVSFRNGYEHRPFNVLDDGSIQLGAKNQLSWIGTSHSWTVSAEHYSEKLDAAYYQTKGTTRGAKFNQTSQWRHQTNLAAWALYSPNNKLNASLGVNLNMASYRFKDEFDDATNTSGRIVYSPMFSPRAGLNYQLATGWYAYASVGQGFSHPTAEESLMPDGRPNSGLHPETGWSAETGIRYHSKNQRLWMETAIYRLWLSNLLVTKRLDEATFYGINAGKTNHMGVESSGWYLVPLSNNRNNVKASWSAWTSSNRFVRFVDNGTDYTGNRLPGIPDYTIHLGLSAVIGNGWEYSVDYRQWGKQWFNDGNTLHNNQWENTEAKLIKTIDTKRLQFTVHIGVQNIFDKRYASMILVNAPSFNGSLPRYYYPAMPRYVNGGLSVSMR